MENNQTREPWNKGKLIGQKPPLKLKDIWAIRIDLRLGKHIRDLAMFNLNRLKDAVQCAVVAEVLPDKTGAPN